MYQYRTWIYKAAFDKLLIYNILTIWHFFGIMPGVSVCNFTS